MMKTQLTSRRRVSVDAARTLCSMPSLRVSAAVVAHLSPFSTPAAAAAGGLVQGRRVVEEQHSNDGTRRFPTAYEELQSRCDGIHLTEAWQQRAETYASRLREAKTHELLLRQYHQDYMSSYSGHRQLNGDAELV